MIKLGKNCWPFISICVCQSTVALFVAAGNNCRVLELFLWEKLPSGSERFKQDRIEKLSRNFLNGRRKIASTGKWLTEAPH